MAYQSQCKVCNSKMKDFIEQLYLQKMSPEKIFEKLQDMQDPMDRRTVMEEKLKPQSIRRHLTRHFDSKGDTIVQTVAVKEKVRESRKKLQQGTKINIDQVNTLSHLIEVALLNIEQLETESSATKHKYTISYIDKVKGLIDELHKISGEIKQEGTIDSNFYRTQMDAFAKLVLSTIRALDMQYDMHYELETAFAEEFKKQWALFKKREDMIFAGQLSPKDGEKERSVNTFNDANSLV